MVSAVTEVLARQYNLDIISYSFLCFLRVLCVLCGECCLSWRQASDQPARRRRKNSPRTFQFSPLSVDSRLIHADGLNAGGHDNGKPGLRIDYSPTYYAAFLLDPDGNNVEAVFMKF